MPTFRLLPHGNYSLIPAILASMGWLASLFQDGCDYSQVTGDIVAELATDPNVPYLEAGINAYREPVLDTKSGNWHVVYEGQCYNYPDTVVQKDAYWIAAEAFDFMALVLGGGATFFLWFTGCCIFSPGTWRWAGYEVLLAAIFQALSFLWFQTSLCRNFGSTNCALFWGSKADIVSTVLWIVAALSIFFYYPIPKDGGEDIDGVWMEDGSGTVNRPRVEMSENTHRFDHPTVTTETADYEDDSFQFDAEFGPNASTATATTASTTTPAGQSSSQEQQQQRPDEGEVPPPLPKPDLRDVELT